MLMQENDVQVRQCNAEDIRIFFYASSGNAAYTLAVKSYTSAFGLSNLITHCKIQFGGKLYEVSREGCWSIPYVESNVLADEKLTLYWHCNLKSTTELDRERNATIEFLLDRDVAANRRWSPKQCLRYLGDYTRNRAWSLEEPQEVDYNLSEGTIKRSANGFLNFSLPFTCATQATNVLKLLIGSDAEPVINSHLPASVFLLCLTCQDNNYGWFYKANEKP